MKRTDTLASHPAINNVPEQELPQIFRGWFPVPGVSERLRFMQPDDCFFSLSRASAQFRADSLTREADDEVAQELVSISSIL